MSTIKSLAMDNGMHADADRICGTFEKAFTNFSKCHKGYSGGAMDDEAIDQLGRILMFSWTT